MAVEWSVGGWAKAIHDIQRDVAVSLRRYFDRIGRSNAAMLKYSRLWTRLAVRFKKIWDGILSGVYHPINAVTFLSLAI